MSEEAETEGKYSCTVCKMTFRRKDRLDRHFFIHTGIVSLKKLKILLNITNL